MTLKSKIDVSCLSKLEFRRVDIWCKLRQSLMTTLVNGANYSNWLPVAFRNVFRASLSPHAVSLHHVPPLGRQRSQFDNLFSRLPNIHKSLEDAAPPLGCRRSTGRGRGADWGQQNATSIHVCNGYTVVIVQRDPPTPLPSPLTLPPTPHHNIN